MLKGGGRLLQSRNKQNCRDRTDKDKTNVVRQSLCAAVRTYDYGERLERIARQLASRLIRLYRLTRISDLIAM